MTPVEQISAWILPLILILVPLVGLGRGIGIYDAFARGAADGLRMAARLFPYLLAIFLAIGMFRDGGALHALVQAARPLTRLFGIPPAVLPLLVVRPLSGGAALGVLAELLRHSGPDSPAGRLASVLMGTTDTTFYVLALYFGAVGVRDMRYALWLGLIGDASAVIGGLVAVHLFLH